MATSTQRLTGLDAAFLALETERSTGHVAGLSVLDPSTADAPLDLARLRRLYAERLPLVPVLRRRLVRLPLGLDQPYWVDDPHFDLTYHVRESALPEPGTDEQLCELIARLHERPLDLDRPPWEGHLITGVAGGRVASYLKIHHAAMDGVSGNDVIGALMDPTPQGRELPEAPTWDPPPLPDGWRIGWRVARDLARRPRDAVRLVGDVARTVPSVLPWAGPALARALSGGTAPEDPADATAGRAPHTPLNQDITPHRRLGLTSLELAEVRAVKDAFGVSVNDVVLTLCAGALRRWLLRHDALPERPLVAMVPVSIRAAGSASGPTADLGNQVSAMLAQLPTHLADPVERLRQAHEASSLAKAQRSLLPQGLVDEVTDFAPPALVSRAFRTVFASHLLNQVPAFNVVISNIPGPQVPIYLAGARLEAHYPVSIVTDGLGLNITVISYLGRLHFGLLADRTLVPDVDAMANDLGTELGSLLAAADAPRLPS